MEILTTRFQDQLTGLGSVVPTHFRYNGFIYSGEFDFKITIENGLEILHINSRNKMLFALKIQINEVVINGESYLDVDALVRDLIIMQRFKSAAFDIPTYSERD
jgi:hypothetical protein